jgi:hypothetical protein
MSPTPMPEYTPDYSGFMLADWPPPVPGTAFSVKRRQTLRANAEADRIRERLASDGYPQSTTENA